MSFKPDPNLDSYCQVLELLEIKKENGLLEEKSLEIEELHRLQLAQLDEELIRVTTAYKKIEASIEASHSKEDERERADSKDTGEISLSEEDYERVRIKEEVNQVHMERDAKLQLVLREQFSRAKNKLEHARLTLESRNDVCQETREACLKLGMEEKTGIDDRKANAALLQTVEDSIGVFKVSAAEGQGMTVDEYAEWDKLKTLHIPPGFEAAPDKNASNNEVFMWLKSTAKHAEVRKRNLNQTRDELKPKIDEARMSRNEAEQEVEKASELYAVLEADFKEHDFDGKINCLRREELQRQESAGVLEKENRPELNRLVLQYLTMKRETEEALDEADEIKYVNLRLQQLKMMQVSGDETAQITQEEEEELDGLTIEVLNRKKLLTAQEESTKEKTVLRMMRRKKATCEKEGTHWSQTLELGMMLCEIQVAEREMEGGTLSVKQQAKLLELHECFLHRVVAFKSPKHSSPSLEPTQEKAEHINEESSAAFLLRELSGDAKRGDPSKPKKGKLFIDSFEVWRDTEKDSLADLNRQQMRRLVNVVLTSYANKEEAFVKDQGEKISPKQTELFIQWLLPTFKARETANDLTPDEAALWQRVYKIGLPARIAKEAAEAATEREKALEQALYQKYKSLFNKMLDALARVERKELKQGVEQWKLKYLRYTRGDSTDNNSIEVTIINPEGETTLLMDQSYVDGVGDATGMMSMELEELQERKGKEAQDQASPSAGVLASMPIFGQQREVGDDPSEGHSPHIDVLSPDWGGSASSSGDEEEGDDVQNVG